MAKDDREIVSAVLLALADKVGAERFETWFGSHTRLSLSGDTLVVRVASTFYQDWLRKTFRPLIEATCLDVIGHAVTVVFQVDATLSAVALPEQASTAANPGTAVLTSNGNEKHPTQSTVTSGVGPPNSQPPGIFARRRFSSFDDFILGDGNRLAHTATRQVLENPGFTSPLVLCGPTGVGKTHLLESVWVATRRFTSFQAVYLTAEQFASQFVDALSGRGLPLFRRKYRGLDLLIVDDVQFFAGKKATQGELLHTVDTLLSAGKQIVFACDRSPAELKEVMPELIARLQGGLTCTIEPLDYETRLGIVRRMAARFNVTADDDVWGYVARHIVSHARALAGAIKRLQIAASAAEQPISLELAQHALQELRDSTARCVRLSDVEQAVCRSFGLEPQSLHDQTKTKRTQAARMLAMWLARKHTHSALSEIGQFFGLRSHSTVVSAQKRIDQWVANREHVNLGAEVFAMDDAVRRVERLLLVG